MKVTARAFLLKSDTHHKIKSVRLVQETLARSRILKQLTKFKRPVLDAINRIFMPITRQGYPSLWSVSLNDSLSPTIAEAHFGWFSCRYQQKTLAWWRIDRCTLEQLASSYYGSQKTPLSSPLRQPTQSEFRLIKRLFSNVFEALPLEGLDVDELEVELVKSHSPIEADAMWSLDFATGAAAPAMQIYMASSLLSLIKDTPSQKPVSTDLPAKLANWLTQVPVKLQLTLGHQNIPVDSLDQMKAGDILPINLYPKSIFTVGTKALFSATVHSHDGQMLAKLTQDTNHYEDNKVG
ncbi:FliM/FliN family flagellar motor switch protein [Shewanella sp.]